MAGASDAISSPITTTGTSTRIPRDPNWTHGPKYEKRELGAKPNSLFRGMLARCAPLPPRTHVQNSHCVSNQWSGTPSVPGTRTHRWPSAFPTVALQPLDPQPPLLGSPCLDPWQQGGAPRSLHEARQEEVGHIGIERHGYVLELREIQERACRLRERFREARSP